MGRFDEGRLLVVGGTGRLGGLLGRAWMQIGQGGLVWQRRTGAGAGPRFDPLGDPAAYARAAAGASAILNLAGRVGGSARDDADHACLAQAALRAARDAGVAHVFLASSAAVYGNSPFARETDAPAPVTGYGRAKAAMEEAALAWAAAHPGGPGLSLLRIANVAGADALLAAQPGPDPQMLDIFPDGTGPRRSYLGPRTLAGILSRLVAHARPGGPLPEVLNVALDGAVAMEALLDASGRAWAARPAPATALPVVRLDVARLAAIAGPLPAADAASIVADLRATLAEAP
ncbi:NAD-dependent epimerase/dehydratase family protein [Albidovulum sp.]|uniref:NAD-dependent epimerase/dehydratase family protein n=1 Tax=Albidovulum sp. TaxID=1872424 RepID=UPI0039B960E8